MIKNLILAIVSIVAAVVLTYEIYGLRAYGTCLSKLDQSMLGVLFVIGLAINGISRIARLFESESGDA